MVSHLTFFGVYLRAFPVLVQQLITTADNSLLNEGCACLSAYVSRAPGLLLQWCVHHSLFGGPGP
jgi:hypothetical protein